MQQAVEELFTATGRRMKNRKERDHKGREMLIESEELHKTEVADVISEIAEKYGLQIHRLWRVCFGLRKLEGEL